MSPPPGATQQAEPKAKLLCAWKPRSHTRWVPGAKRSVPQPRKVRVRTAPLAAIGNPRLHPLGSFPTRLPLHLRAQRPRADIMIIETMDTAVLSQLDRFGPDHCEQLTYEQATQYTRALAQSHYENFTVVSWLLPRHLRDDFRHVYAFCRWADDLGDEAGDRTRALQLLDWWRREIDACYAGAPRHPVFVALRQTIQRHDIPRKPFDDLVDAFAQDQTVVRYRTWDQLLDYCTRSANPVGRLVLYMCGYRDPERQSLSDATCTALQLANFWQDVRRDALDRDRVYIPEEVARRHGLDIELMAAAIRADASAEEPAGCGCSGACHSSAGIRALLPSYRATLHELVDRTWPLFTQGRQLWPLVSPQVRSDIKLFTLGGESILRMIQRQDYDTLSHRPSLSRPAKARLMLRVLLGRFVPHWLRRGGTDPTSASGSPQTPTGPPR